MVSLATKSGLAPNISDLDRDSTRWVIGRYKIQYSLHSLVFNGVLLSLPSAILNYFEWTMLSPFCAARCSYPLYLVCPPGFSPVASILDFKSPYQQVTDCPVSYSTFTKLADLYSFNTSPILFCSKQEKTKEYMAPAFNFSNGLFIKLHLATASLSLHDAFSKRFLHQGFVAAVTLFYGLHKLQLM